MELTFQTEIRVEYSQFYLLSGGGYEGDLKDYMAGPDGAGFAGA